jgi:hypothetical protein
VDFPSVPSVNIWVKLNNRAKQPQALSLHWRVSAFFEHIVDRHINIGCLSGFTLCLLALAEG